MSPANITYMNITAIIFDMDGVLIDSEPAHKLAKERAFARFGITLPEQVYEQYKGRPDDTMMNEVVPSIPQLSVDVQEMLRIKRLEFEAVEHLALPIPGATEFVRWARGKFRIALATSATPRNRQTALRVLGLSDIFDFVVDASGFSRPKPDPEIFHTALRGLDADPAQCLVIEDSLHGVVAAKAAGSSEPVTQPEKCCLHWPPQGPHTGFRKAQSSPGLAPRDGS